jgi:DNA repair exonuclease SbcCD nuclease subunit
MIKIKSDILIFTDIHFGLRSDSIIRLDICKKIVTQIIEELKNNKSIKNVIFLGDIFHSRSSLNVNTINIAINSIKDISKHAHVYLILGNHDIHYKNSADIHSIKMFEGIKNITVIDKPTIVNINDKEVLMVPWLGDISEYKKEQFDMLMGHFDISSKYLISSYIEEHSYQDIPDVNYVINKLINDDIIYDIENQSITNEELNELLNNKNKRSSKYIGNFIDLCKKNGVILSGHIHTRKEFKIKGRNFIFIGSPQEQNFGDIDGSHGFYLYINNRFKFVKSEDIPKHIELKISDINNKGIDSFDFSICKNNIVKMIIDEKIDHVKHAEIMNRINDFKPLEEFPPEYQTSICFSNNEEINLDKTHELIKKSKSDYIMSYIDSVNESDLKPNNIDKNKLYNIVMQYYIKTQNSIGDI